MSPRATIALVLTGLAALLPSASYGQLVAIDTTRPIIADEIVVTATRSARALERVPVPVTIISAEEIEVQAVPRLSDLLDSQLGFNLQYNRLGSVGVQLQGLDASYTLVLLDGEPLVGNVEGFVDLSRISAASIERVEITHGPSSSLYGSEALAGVVNIITRKSSRRFDTSAQVQYGTNSTLDLSANAGFRGASSSFALYLNRYSTDGYDLFPEIPGPTVPPFANYDVTANGQHRFSNRTSLRATARVSTQDLDGISAIQQGTPDDSRDQNLTRTDWSIAPALSHRLSSSSRLELSTQAARSKADATYAVEGLPGLQDFFNFDQFRSKTEIQTETIHGDKFLSSGGAGMLIESVDADFMAGEGRTATSGFAYGQLEWIPRTELDFIGSVRVDAHPDYATQVNPKLAALWKASRSSQVKASVGRGFRAPTFEQRYVNFTNPLGGNYTVLGTEGLHEALRQFDEAGYIKEYLVDPDDLREIAPENSWSYNVGGNVTIGDRLLLRGLVFRNDVSNLIETQVLAIKTDGQNLYSYVNLGSVYTQGFDVDSELFLPYGLSVAAGYQFLDAWSVDLDAPLGGRSKHSGRVKLQADSDRFGLTAYALANVRSSYPFVTGAAVMVDGSTLIDVVLSKQITRGFSVGGGIRNLLDHTAPFFSPELPGREFFVRITLSNQSD